MFSDLYEVQTVCYSMKVLKVDWWLVCD